MNEAANWLKKIKGQASLREMEEVTGLHHMTIAKAEKGEATAETWIQLAEHFNESVLMVLYWAGKLQRPPTKEELELEFQTRIANNVVKLFPPEERENALKRLELEAEIQNGRTKQRAARHARPRNAE